MPACVGVTSAPAFHIGSVVGGLALLIGCAMSGCGPW